MPYTIPHQYQREGAAFIERSKGRCLVGDEMGLGKTLQALLYLRRHPELRPAIVVCPASLKWTWEREAAVHFGMAVEVLEGMRPPHEGLTTTHGIIVLNYDILHAWLPHLAALRPKILVGDEAHYIVNRKARRSKATKTLAQLVRHVVLLSGTPLTNRPTELWQLLNILRPDLFPSFWTFAHRYTKARMTPWGWDFSKPANLDELHRVLINKRLMIRRLKKDVLSQLPPKTRSVVPLEIEDRRQYQTAVHDFVRWLRTKKRSRKASASMLVKIGYLRRLAGELKVKPVMSWVDDFLEGGDGKLVLFAIHKPVVAAFAGRYKGQCVVVDGSVVGRDRMRAVDAFQHDKRIRVFIGNIKAAGVGITLTAASTVAFAELEWTPGAMVQAEDRCHRIGTMNHVQAFWLVAKNTIEEKIAALIEEKFKTLNAVLDGGQNDDDLSIIGMIEDALQAENSLFNGTQHKRIGTKV